MEAAKIDWNKIESVFVVDHVFENINAPQWVDFLASSSSSSDDVAWFCRPDCKHPATAEDFLASTPCSSSSKLLRCVSVSKLIGLGDWSGKEGSGLKRRNPSSSIKDTENQNPNMWSTPPQSTTTTTTTTNCNKYETPTPDELSENERLKESKELLGGRDIFGKISELCNELKKITRVKERQEDNPQGQGPLKVKSVPPPPVPVAREKEEKTLNECNKERKPLLQLKPQAQAPAPKLRRNLREIHDEAENIPISLNNNNVKRDAKISPIRTNPPTPQGFSATRDPVNPTSSNKSKLLEREVLQELGHKKTLKDELDDDSNDNENASLVSTKQGRTLDMFWFLKPCTLSS